MATMIDRARAFLELRRIALVGVSKDPRAFSRAILRELLGRGYDVASVNPSLADVDGRRCFARVQDADPPVDGVLIMTRPSAAAEIVRDCAAAGVRHVWFHRGGGPGSASAEALELCRVRGIEFVTDVCPFMALPQAGWIHRVHALFRRSARRPVE